MQTEIKNHEPEVIKFDLRNAVYADWNYKIDSEERLDKLIINILEDGFLQTPLVRIDEEGRHEMVDGNHRKQAVEKILNIVSEVEKYHNKNKAHGKFEEKVFRLYNEKGYDFTSVPVMFVGAISIKAAKKISIKLNAQYFDNDIKARSRTIVEIMEEFDMEVLEEMPFDLEEYEMLAAQASEEARKRIYDVSEGVDKTFERLETGIRTIKVECTKDTYELWLSLRQKLASLGVTSDIQCIEIILHEVDKIPLTKIKV